MILFDLFENIIDENDLNEKTENPYSPSGTSRDRGMIHITLIDKYRDTNQPVKLEFEDGAIYRVAYPKDKEWFLNVFNSYRQAGKQDAFFELIGSHPGFEKLVKKYTLDQAKEMEQRIKQVPGKKKTVSAYRNQAEYMDEAADDMRTRRMLDRMRAQFPQAKNDLEAILYSLDDAKQKTRNDIDNLEQELDRAEDDIKTELQTKLQDINRQRSRISDRVGEIQASDQEQQGIIDKIIKIDQAQQQALNDLEKSVKEKGSEKTAQAQNDLDQLTKQVASQKNGKKKSPARSGDLSPAKSLAARSVSEPDTEPSIPAAKNNVVPMPIKQKQLPLPSMSEPEFGLARVAETTKPQLRRIHYFVVKPGDEQSALEMGLEKNRAGSWVLKQYNTSGIPFNRRFAQIVGFFGRPVRSDNVESVGENTQTPSKPRNFVAKHAPKSGAGAHRDRKREAKQGETKHKKSPLGEAEKNLTARQRVDALYKKLNDLKKSNRINTAQGRGLAKQYLQQIKDLVKTRLPGAAIPSYDEWLSEDSFNHMTERAAVPINTYRDVYQKLEQLQSMGHVPSDQTKQLQAAAIDQIKNLVNNTNSAPLAEGIGSDMVATWQLTLDDGSTATIKTSFDELNREDAARTLKLQHPELASKNIAKIELLDYRVDTGSWGSAPAAPYPDHRPTEPFGRPVDNPMIKESWKPIGTKTFGNLQVRIYKDTTWGKYAVEFFQDGEYLQKETYRADDAEEAKEVIKHFFQFGKTMESESCVDETSAEKRDRYSHAAQRDMARHSAAAKIKRHVRGSDDSEAAEHERRVHRREVGLQRAHRHMHEEAAEPVSEIGLRGLGEAKKKPVPTNADLWSRAKSAAKSKFDVYPSAYANAWAAKWYKAKGGGWRMGEPKNEDMETLHEVQASYVGDYTFVRHSPDQPWVEYLRGEPTGRTLSSDELIKKQKDITKHINQTQERSQ